MAEAPAAIGPAARQTRRPGFLAAALVGFVGLCVWRLGFAPVPPQLVVVQGKIMGTTYTAKVVVRARDQRSEQAKQELAKLVHEALSAVDHTMSTWKPKSELSRFNDGPGEADVSLSPSMVEVLAVAFDVNRRSGGAFDVTVGPLVERWGFGAKGKPATLPDPAEVDALRAVLGMDHLDFEPAAATLRKDRAELRVDLSAVAKGYGVDQAAQALAAAGHPDYLVEVGGEVRVAGRNEAGRPWRLAVERPHPDRRAVQEVIELERGALATSGDYRNFTIVDGKRYSHTIDPTSGRPVEHRLASVSVVAETCAEADALATALNVLGPERGLELAQREGLAALFLIGDPDSLETRATKAWEPLRARE